MGYVLAVIVSALGLFVYVRMCRREIPEPMKPWRAIVPVVLGIVAPFLSTGLTVAINGGAFKLFGVIFRELTPNPYVNSFLTSFFYAGFTEEIIKLVLILIAIKIVKPRKVYEYALIGAAVGFGFTITEEYLYLADPEGGWIFALMRLPGFAMHMVFDLIMGLGLGVAKNHKQTGKPGSGRWVALGILVPMLWHTLYDAATIANPITMSQGETVVTVGIVYAGIMLIGSTIAQFVILWKFRTNTERSCSLSIEW